MNQTGVSVQKLAELMDLKNYTEEINLKKCRIETSEVNRPAIQLTGYFDHFEESRIEIIGNVEYTYVQKLSVEEKTKRFKELLKFDIPCII